MLLASVADIRNELGFDDMTNINAAISSALNAAEPQLASGLNTRFAREEVTDTFWVREPTVVDGQHVKTEFWLSRGFLVSDPTPSGVPFNLDGALKVDREKGVICDWSTRYSNNHVSFTYRAGFEADATNPGSYKLDQVPGWLKEAAKLLALIHLSNSPSITEAGIKIDVDVLRSQLGSLMEQHIRYAPLALYPL